MKNKEIAKELISCLLYLVVAMVAAWLLLTFVGQRINVDGESMEATLQDGDSLIMDKISYRFKDPQRFDVIVFPVENDHNKEYIKRIIGLPGETVQIDEGGNIYINGELLEESYGREVIEPGRIGLAAEPITLGEDEYFVLGDNRNHSTDSRTVTVGNVKRKEIEGRAWLRIWPLNNIGFVKNM